MLQLNNPFSILTTCSSSTQTYSHPNKFLNPTTHSNSICLSEPTSKSTTPNLACHSIQETRTNLSHKIKKGCKFETISEFNELLMAMVDSNELGPASKLFANLSYWDLIPNCWTYSIMVRCYCKNKEPYEAERVVRHMLDKGFRPNVATFTVLLNEFCVGGRVREAREVLKMMGKMNCKPTIQTYNCLLKGLCYVGKVEEAYELLVNLNKNYSVEPDIYTYTAIMDGFCKVGRSGEAFELLDEALELGLVPNVATYSTLLTGYFKEGKPLEGLGLLKKMRKQGCEPDYTAYNTLLHGLLKWGEIRESLGVYKEMVQVGLRVDGRIMNTLLRGLCRKSRREKELLNDAYGVFDRMNTWAIDVYDFTFDLVIEAFCRGRKTDEALASLESMVGLGYNPKQTTFDNVIITLCHEGRVEEALKVLVMYWERGSPSRVMINIVIDELNFQSRRFGSSPVYGLALKLGVDPKV